MPFLCSSALFYLLGLAENMFFWREIVSLMLGGIVDIEVQLPDVGNFEIPSA